MKRAKQLMQQQRAIKLSARASPVASSLNGPAAIAAKLLAKEVGNACRARLCALPVDVVPVSRASMADVRAGCARFKVSFEHARIV